MPAFKLMNDHLTLTVSSKGAEIRSLKRNDSGREFMWQADPKYWGWTAPVLFPIVGAVRNNEYRFEGKTYHMNQHGFARHSEFTHAPVAGCGLGFVLTDSSETLAAYPFPFRLEVGYTLEKRTVIVKWRVKNTGETKMFFSIGAHPAFNCPPYRECKKSDCFLAFDTVKPLVSSLLNLEKGGVSSRTKEEPLTKGSLPIRDDLFDINTLIIENEQAHKMSLNTPDRRPYVTVAFDAPLFGIWSPSKEAPFVCLEPWYGLADGDEFTGNLEDRRYIQALEPGKTWAASYRITV